MCLTVCLTVCLAGGAEFGGAGPAIELPADAFDHGGHSEPGGHRPDALATFAVLGLGSDHELGAHAALGCQRPDQLFDQMTAGEHHRIEMLHRGLEMMIDCETQWWIFCTRRTVVGPRRHPTRGSTLPSEARQHIGLGQRSQITQRAQAQPGQQMHLISSDIADIAQPPQCQRGQEGRRITRRNDMRMTLPRGVTCRHPSSKSPVGDAHANATSNLADCLLAGNLLQRVVDQVGDSLCHRQVAAEVSRWPTSSEGQQTRP